jgi:hypothetical protein
VLEGLALWLNVNLRKIFATNIYYRLSSINILTNNFALSAVLCLIEKRTLLVYLTNAVKQSLYWAVKSCPSDSKVIPRTLSNFIALYDSHNSLSLLHIPSQVKSFTTSHLFYIKLNLHFPQSRTSVSITSCFFQVSLPNLRTYLFSLTCVLHTPPTTFAFT